MPPHAPDAPRWPSLFGGSRLRAACMEQCFFTCNIMCDQVVVYELFFNWNWIAEESIAESMYFSLPFPYLLCAAKLVSINLVFMEFRITLTAQPSSRDNNWSLLESFLTHLLRLGFFASRPTLANRASSAESKMTSRLWSVPTARVYMLA